MQPVRLLLIGAGVIGRTHIDRIGRDPHLALAGIAEPSEAGKALAQQLGVPWAASHLELLERTQAQGAIVATPNASHVGMAIDCLERGVAALVEKPVADTVAEALALDSSRPSSAPVCRCWWGTTAATTPSTAAPAASCRTAGWAAWSPPT